MWTGWSPGCRYVVTWVNDHVPGSLDDFLLREVLAMTATYRDEVVTI